MYSYDELVNKILAIWRSVLKMDKLEKTDDYIAAGGDSLKAAMICVKIRSELKLEISVQQIIERKNVEQLVRQILSDKVQDNAVQGITKVEKQDKYPLSWSQKAIYLLHKIFPRDIGMAYNLPGYAVIEGEVDVPRLIGAIKDVVRNQQALRLTFLEIGGEIYQKINLYADFEIPYSESTEANISEVLKDFWHPFDLTNGPLYRFEIYKLPDGKYYLLADMHHLVSDGVSISILLKQIQRYYEGAGTSPEFSFIDYVVYQNDISTSDAINRQRDFWQKKYNDDLPSISLPYDYARNRVRSFTGERKDFIFDSAACGQIESMCKKHNTTIFNILLTCMFVLLYKYSSEKDIIIGTSAAGRNVEGINDTIGLFINTLPVRGSLDGSISFEELLRNVKGDIYSCLENQDYQFLQIVSTTISKGELGRSPVFDVMFEVQNIDFVSDESAKLKIVDYVYQGQGSRFDLLFEINLLRSGGLRLTIEYRTDLFRPESIDRMNSHYNNIIDYVSKNPQAPIKQVQMITPEEFREISENFQGPVKNDIPPSIMEGFFDRAKQWKNKTAIINGENKYTYSELVERCFSAIRAIRRNKKSNNKPIGLYMERSETFIFYVLSLLYLGIPYIPLNIKLPEHRLLTILETCGCTQIITDQKDVDFPGVEVVYPFSDNGTSETEMPVAERSIKGDETAYIMYTSGTTGTPKCIAISHQALSNFSYAMKDTVFSGANNILAITAISFDPSFLETVIPLLFGLTVTIVPEKFEYNPKEISDIIIRNEVDLVQLTPSRLKSFDGPERNIWLNHVDTMLVGGEPMDVSIYEIFEYNPSLNIYNMYGPTETTIWSTLKRINKNGPITVGKPIYNTKVAIVDDSRQTVPIGVAGNLLIGGTGLMNEYVGNPGLTAEKVYEHNGTKMYDTGDIAKFLPNSEIELLGRRDNQVKVRGQRVELEDITSNFLKIDGMREAGVIYKNNVLFGFCTVDSNVDEAKIKAQLREKLPEYMIPNQIVILEQMPLTITGKIDYKGLWKLAEVSKSDSFCLPQNELQEKIQSCWEKVFKRDGIGIRDDFFNIGGNSILAIHLVFELEQIGMELTYEEVYKLRTIEQMDEYIKGRIQKSS